MHEKLFSCLAIFNAVQEKFPFDGDNPLESQTIVARFKFYDSKCHKNAYVRYICT